MWYKEDKFIVKLGSNFYENTPNLIVYKGENLFVIKRSEGNGLLGIDFNIYDEKGNKIAVVKEGRIYSGDEKKFEIIKTKDEYILKNRETGAMICDIKKRSMADHAELDVNVSLYTKDGFLINATPESTNIGSNAFRGNYIKDCGAGIVVE